MTLPLWGSLEKSQDDPETIEEAIARLVEAHNDDSEAHLGAGQSLEAHKTEGMIDHPAGSVASDKLAQKRFVVTNFESLDGWGVFATGTGTRYLNFPGVVLQTGTTTSSRSTLYTGQDGFTNFDTAKSFMLKYVIRLSHSSGLTFRFGIGALGGGDGTAGVGFIYDGTNLKAYYEDEEVVTTGSAITCDITVAHVYEVRYVGGSDSFGFYIDGVLVATLSHTFVDTQADILFNFNLYNTTGAQRQMYVSDAVAELDL